MNQIDPAQLGHRYAIKRTRLHGVEMSFMNKPACVIFTGLLLVATSGAAFAQAGGSDVPTDAKKQGTMENGSSSTGMSKGEAKGGMMKKDGMMKSEDGAMKKSGDKM